MAFLVGKLDLKVYSDVSETEFPKELVPQITKEFEDLTISGVQVSSFSLAAAATQAINTNGIGTVKRFYLYSSVSDLSISINGLAALTYEAGIPGFAPITVSSLSITNSSASIATVVSLVLVTG